MTARRACTVALMAVVTIFAKQQACAQSNSLPAGIITKQEGLSEGDKTQVRDFIQRAIEQLRDGSDQDVASAKNHLKRPALHQGARQYFLIEYRRVLGRQLTDVFNAEAAGTRPIVRINVMIVAEALRDPAGTPLLTEGLKDENPAVRYWAAKAAIQIVESGNLAADAQKALLGALAEAMKVEQFQQVLERLMKAVVLLPIADAREKVLETLNHRVAVHFEHPEFPMGAELGGLRPLRNAMVRINSRKNPPPPNDLKLITQVACRYLVLTATLLENDRIPRRVEQGYLEMLIVADETLKWVLGEIREAAMPTGLMADITPTINARDWQQIVDRANAWQAMIVADSGLGLKDADLQIQPPKPAEETAE